MQMLVVFSAPGSDPATLLCQCRRHVPHYIADTANLASGERIVFRCNHQYSG